MTIRKDLTPAGPAADPAVPDPAEGFADLLAASSLGAPHVRPFMAPLPEAIGARVAEHLGLDAAGPPCEAALPEQAHALVITVAVQGGDADDEATRARTRAELRTVLYGAFADVGVPEAALYWEERGDGVLLAMHGDVPPGRLLGSWPAAVHERLRRANAGRRAPLALLIGMDAGPVFFTMTGIHGTAVAISCRLSIARPTWELLDRERADIALAASNQLFEEATRYGGPSFDPDAFTCGRVGRRTGAAWFQLPGRPRPLLDTRWTRSTAVTAHQPGTSIHAAARMFTGAEHSRPW
ncbi:hypothetical protein [Kitasatospora viridis]|uniref:Uncharacterized protein n=1 Tax=Kitasatospora viridis TaxID=281105 RepID=A0A561TV35_9ACTN|nr:hypothetical protein [Kitasatospora viridis]TWF90976.1 hypothetical protein FHX73_1288 [Kitasatospora viridis]